MGGSQGRGGEREGAQVVGAQRALVGGTWVVQSVSHDS